MSNLDQVRDKTIKRGVAVKAEKKQDNELPKTEWA
jgi:hypothetical protein